MYKLYSNVLGPEVNAETLDFALGKEAAFRPSKTIGRDPRYSDWRRSAVIFADQLGEVGPRIEAVVRDRLPEVLAHLGMAPFGGNRIELQLTAHGDGQYYQWHTDNGAPETRTRAVTFVYYFHAIPKGFSGGELVIHAPGGDRMVIEPQNDSLVFFAAGTRHEVLPVRCPSHRFMDGRFTLNGWVHQPVARPPRPYFDEKVLGSRPSRLRGGVGPEPRPDMPASGSGQADRRSAAATARVDAGLAHGLLDLFGALWRKSGRAGMIEHLDDISSVDFFERYYFRNLPVLVRGAIRNGTAVRTWSPDVLARRFGSKRIETTSGREADPDYETNFRQTTTTVTMSELADRLRTEADSNDFYVVARNNFFRNPAFDPLRREIGAPDDIVDASGGSDGSVKLWIGPRGTVTPLHFDLHSILFAQIHGRKRFRLIPPFDASKLYVRRRFYSAVDPEAPDLARYPLYAEASVAEVVVEPGDILFLPVGWWHWVRSLDTSISATFSRFRIPGGNDRLDLGSVLPAT